jgi:hypothetical protein
MPGVRPLGLRKVYKIVKMLGLIVCLNLLAFSCASHDRRPSGVLSVAAKEAEGTARLFRIFENGKFGFIDRRGSVVIEPKFDEVEDFSEGFALVSFNGKKGFIDGTGKLVIVPKDFEVINGFTDGLARGNITTTSPYTKGYIDKSGGLVINTRALGACEFSEGLACVEAGKWGFIDPSGQFVIKPQFDEVSYFREGLATATFRDHSKASRRKQGYLDKTGKVVIKPQFDVAQPFSDGLAAVGMMDGDDYLFGFIDKAGVMVIKPQFEWTYTFHEGLAAVKVSGKWGFVDKNGGMVIKPIFDKAEGFSEGLAAVAAGGVWGYIDKTGKYAIEPRFNEAMAFNEGLAFVKIGGYDADAIIDVVGGFDTQGKWGYIDKTGKYIWQPTN